jgi:hypothetical protein
VFPLPYRLPSPPPQEREVVPPAPDPNDFDLATLVLALLFGAALHDVLALLLEVL